MNRVEPVRKRVRVNLQRTQAFDLFTAGMSRWWPPQHSLLASPMRECIIEPFVGGRWYAVGEDGSQCDNGTVLVWEPPSRLVLAWQINARWQYDSTLITEVEIRFFEMGAAVTEVELEHRNLERMGEHAAAARAAVDSPNGWGAILESFRSHAENQSRR